MGYRGSVLILVFVRCCVVWRVFTLLVTPIESLPDLPANTSLTLAELRRSSPEHGITHIEFQRFNPDVVFAVQSGPDRMPGIAGTDDNMNGITDDRSELGATRSDDVCVVLSAVELEQSPPDEVMVLQQGAFVSSQGHTVHRGDKLRAIVFGTSADNSHWSFVREPRRPEARGMQTPEGR